MSLPLWLALTASPAHGFCGTYMGGAGAELYNEVSQVALVREGRSTVLSVSNDVDGNFEDFALIIPVPQVLAEDDIHVLDKELFSRLDAYSSPRRVSYTCDDFHSDDEDLAGGGTDGGASGGGGGGGVDVEAEYIIGEYEVVILSATGSDVLYSWLEGNGYSVPAASQPILQEYIDAGSYFLAAKVDASQGVQPGDTLSPLQFRYEAAVYGLPIRIGTTASKGVQDLIVYAVNDYAEGRVGVSNYAEATIEEACMWGEGDQDDFSAFYLDQYAAAYSDADAGVWVAEYAWGGAQCDPCNGEPPSASDLATLGKTVDPETYHFDPNVYFTRLHLRYTPTQAVADLVLYKSNRTEQHQQRYIDYQYELEDRFPLCGVGMADDPGSCDEAGGSGGGGSGSEGGDGADAASGSSSADGADGEEKGCATVPLAPGLGILVGLAALAGRRREDG